MQARFALWPRDWLLLVLVVLVALVAAGAIVLQCLALRDVAASSLLAAIGRSRLFWLAGDGAFPLLATIVGFALAQGSATSDGLTDYELWRLYEGLAVNADAAMKDRIGRSLARVFNIAGREARRAATTQAVLRAGLAELSRLVETPDVPPELHGITCDLAAELGFRTLAIDVVESMEEHDGFTHRLDLRFAPLRSDGDCPAEDRWLTLRLHLAGRDMSVSTTTLDLALPRSGSSHVQALRIAITGEDPALSVLVTRSSEALILQEYTVRLRSAAHHDD